MGLPVGLVLLASFVWALCKNFLTAKVVALEPDILHVLVTGASKGIGKALARRALLDGPSLPPLSRAAVKEEAGPGADVSLVARTESVLKETAAELAAIADGNALERNRSQALVVVPADACNASSVRPIQTQYVRPIIFCCWRWRRR